MQYHSDGFRPGDPEVSDLATGRTDPQGALPEAVDVLIVGCGPAGLTLAAQLSAFPDIQTRIVERRDGPLEKGQADGISCRSMEMFQAFGFAEKVKQQGYWVNETTFWKPDPALPDHIIRSDRIQDVEDGLSEMPHMILNQARVHDLYLDIMHKSPSRLVPDYGFEMSNLVVDDAADDYPVTVALAPVEGGPDRIVRARYVVGCDGARSGVRKAIGLKLKGESASQAWGVMDVLAVTDFPDVRCKTLIQSDQGNILIIPREGGYLTRLYIELDKLNEGERVAGRNIGLDHLTAAAQRIFLPYDFDVKDVVWWSIYEIGQRLTDTFDDVPSGADDGVLPRVFIAGDACHTHSPKAGQGMNVSMGDAFNLGWKLVSVLQGRAAPTLLKTYSAERQAVAKDLIAFDREWSKIMSQRLDTTEHSAGESPKLQSYFQQHGRYTAGLSVCYTPSVLTGETTWQHLAPGFEIGSRFHSAPVVRLADAKPMELGHTVAADTRWRIFAFCPAGDPIASKSAIADLCRYLTTDPDSPVVQFTPRDADLDSVIDLRAVLQQTSREVELEKLPVSLLPRKGRFGLIDYEKVFCAAPGPATDIFALRGIDRASGCIVVVRPDQNVAQILPMHAHRELTQFFANFMLRPA